MRQRSKVTSRAKRARQHWRARASMPVRWARRHPHQQHSTISRWNRASRARARARAQPEPEPEAIYKIQIQIRTAARVGS